MSTGLALRVRVHLDVLCITQCSLCRLQALFKASHRSWCVENEELERFPALPCIVTPRHGDGLLEGPTPTEELAVEREAHW